MIDIKSELSEYRAYYGLIRREKCTEEETEEFNKLVKDKNPLPQGVRFHEGDGTYMNSGYYYRERRSEISREELDELLKYKQTESLESISKGVTFFVVLNIIGIIAVIFLALILFN